MANEILTKSLKESDYEGALRTATNLLNKLKEQPKPSEEDISTIKWLDKLVSVILKLGPEEKKLKESSKTFNLAEDTKILRNYLERQRRKEKAPKKVVKKAPRKTPRKTAAKTVKRKAKNESN